jgi:hypothetical protein
MDFIEGLLKSGATDCILVVVDRFSKYGHFLALSHPFTAPKVAKLFLDQVYRLHGMPDNIVSDRDRVFTSAFWQQLFALSSTQLCMSSSYHPQSDSQTERVNQCIETYLRCFVHACPSKWSQWLPVAEFWYNTNSHSSLDRSPFEVLYGHPPKHFGLHQNSAILVTDLEQWMQEREVISKLIQQHLLRAQSRMKKYADTHRSERVFTVGDRVYLKLQPYVQSSVTRRGNQKLAFRYFGSYTIIQRIGATAYKLYLPDSAQIHPVFHVSQLKAAISRNQVVAASLPAQTDALQIPTKVLQSRLIQKGGVTVAQVKVVWSGMDDSLATWEDLKALQDRFPHAPAWGQAAFQDRGNVSSNSQDVGRADKYVEGESEEEAVARPQRVKRRSVKVFGPEWVV